MKTALQMYSLRELEEKDFLDTLKKAKDAGYDGVEFAGYFEVPAKQLKAELDKLGLKAAGSHVRYENLMNNLEAELEYAKELGLYSVVCPAANADSKEGWEEIGRNLNEIGKKFRENGIIFGYHNHAREFEKFDGEYALDILYNNSDSKNVTCEIDTYWVKRGNEDVVEYTKKYADRSYLLHAKDLYEDGKDANVGEGCIDFKAVTANMPNLEWIVVEQEAFDGDPVECVKIGCKNMKKL